MTDEIKQLVILFKKSEFKKFPNDDQRTAIDLEILFSFFHGLELFIIKNLHEITKKPNEELIKELDETINEFFRERWAKFVAKRG